MEITYDSKADALNITLKKGKIKKTVEIAPEINLDLDKNGAPLYLGSLTPLKFERESDCQT